MFYVCLLLLLSRFSRQRRQPTRLPTKFPEIPVSLERNTEVFRHPLL